MAGNKAQQTAWRSVEQVQDAPLVENDGDIFIPLRRVKAKYAARATKLENMSNDDGLTADEKASCREKAELYLRTALSVNALIPKPL